MLKALLLLSLVALATCLSGGWEGRNVDDEDVLVAANEAARELSKTFAGKYHHKLKKVSKAENQVVPTAGTNYKLTIIVGETVCRKEEVGYDVTASCDFRDTISTYKKCRVVVFRNLKGQHRLVSSGCILASKEDL